MQYYTHVTCIVGVNDSGQHSNVVFKGQALFWCDSTVMTRGDLYGNVSIHKFDLFWIKCETEWSVQVVTYGALSGPDGRLGRRRQSHKLESWWVAAGTSNSGIWEEWWLCSPGPCRLACRSKYFPYLMPVLSSCRTV